MGPRPRNLKDRGLFRRIGFCAAIEDGPALLARRLEADVVQVPCSLLDQRAAQDGVLEAIADIGASVHLSSVFADGLLFAGGEDLPPELASHAQALSRTRRRLAEQRCDPMQAALAYALSLKGVDKVVASVASAAELRAILAAAHAPCPNLDWSGPWRLRRRRPSPPTPAPGSVAQPDPDVAGQSRLRHNPADC